MIHETAVAIPEMADLLNISADTVYRQARAGVIPGFKVGGSWRFLPTEVFAKLKTPADPWQQSSKSTARRRAT